MLFPAKLEDETLYSLVCRLAIVNGLSPENIAISATKTNAPRVADIEVDFLALANFTNGVYGTAESLLENYLVNPARLSQADFSLIGISNKNKNIWRWCKECTAEEEREIGIAYWHHLHQQPCVTVCDKHHQSLIEINTPFRQRQSKFQLPRDAALMHPYPSCRKQNIQTALALTNIQKSLLNEPETLNIRIAQNLFRSNPKSEQSVSLYKHAIKTISSEKSGNDGKLKHQVSLEHINNEYLPIHIYANYGSYGLFKNHYEWHHTMNRGALLEEDIIYVDLQTRHRKVCTDFLDGQHSAFRADLWKHAPQSARWLSRYDSDWFAKALPNRGLKEGDRQILQKQLFTNKLLKSKL